MIEDTPVPPDWKSETPAAQASATFLKRIQGASGIRAVRSTNAPDGSTTGVVVYVHSRHSPEADRIYDVLFEIEDLYSGCELDISLSEAEPPCEIVNGRLHAAAS